MTMRYSFWALFLIGTVVAIDVVVHTERGTLKGYTSTSTRDGASYAAFLGIPYAQPPVGSLRFKAPKVHLGWHGVRDATKTGFTCVGSSSGSTQNEDCLFLNLYTPTLSPSSNVTLKPLMLFVHGGGFRDGNGNPSSYAPDFFMDHDVLFGTLNYRLGPLGFMSLQIEDCPGNAGLKDIVMALRWVKQNIKYFGGDPNKVILFGESAGSGCVSFVQLSETAKGLFAGTIHESGEALQDWTYATPAQAVSRAYRLAKIAGCNSDDTSKSGRKKLLKCLMKLEPGDLNYHDSKIITAEDYRRFALREFIPTTEPDVPNAFLTRSPIDVILSGHFIKVPSILGSNLREGLLYFGVLNALFQTENQYGQNMTNFLPLDLIPDLTKETEKKAGQMVKDFYLKGKNISRETTQQVLDIVTDTNFIMFMLRQTLLMTQRTDVPIYNYHFIYDGPFTGLRQNPAFKNIKGPVHGDELGYLMNPEYLHKVYAKYDRKSTPQRVIDKMTKMWTNFAKYLDPTPKVDGAIITTKWKPFKPSEHNFLEIGAELKSKVALAGDRMHMWNDIYEMGQKRRPFPQ